MRSPVCGLSDNANRLSHMGLLVIIRASGEVREDSEREGTEFISA